MFVFSFPETINVSKCFMSWIEVPKGGCLIKPRASEPVGALRFVSHSLVHVQVGGSCRSHLGCSSRRAFHGWTSRKHKGIKTWMQFYCQCRASSTEAKLLLLVVFVGLSIEIPLRSIKLTASHPNTAEASHGCCSDCYIFSSVCRESPSQIVSLSA